VYDAATDTELNATTTSVTYGNASTGTVADMLSATNTVECGSCHDVHATLSGGSTGNADLLSVANTASALCFACHNK
jgi:predicted CXXCH cytochrome family protein